MRTETRWWLATLCFGTVLTIFMLLVHDLLSDSSHSPHVQNLISQRTTQRQQQQTSSSTSKQQQQQSHDVDVLSTPPPHKGPRIRFAFGTDCTNYKSSWQSLALIHSFLRTQHESSTITELIACKDKNYKPKHLIAELHPSTRVSYFVTTFSSPHPITGDDFVLYNKPIAYREWLTEAPSRPDADDIVVLLDHDMILLKPIPAELLAVKPRQAFGGFYGLGTNWPEKEGFVKVCGDLCRTLPPEDRDSLQTGPPLIMRAKDLLDVSHGWYDYTVEIRKHEDIKGWLSEMYAYMISSIKIGLKHKVRTELMVSSDDESREWEPDKVHLVMHYCQRYRVGNWSWSKHDYHHYDPLACDAKNFDLPPHVINIDKNTKQNTKSIFLAYTVITWLNEAFEEYRRYKC